MSAVAPATRPRHERSQPSRRPDIDAAIAAACKKIAPLWPLKHFVAVNPFLGFADSPSPRPAPPCAASPGSTC